MSDIRFGIEFMKEIETEVPATRKCLERVSESLYGFKPHERSMNMGYLVVLVAEIPKWIAYSLEHGYVDFETYPQYQPTTTAALVKHFEENVEGAKKWLQKVTNEELESRQFTLKRGSQILYQQPQKDNISSCINHWVHHRGQLTVYMRLNDIPVPSIYGPSADDKTF